MSTSAHNPPSAQANWIANASLLWDHRRLLARATGITLVLSATIAFLIPKQYDSVVRLMPPDQQSSSTALLAAVAGRSLGGLGSLAGGLLSGHTSTALFIDLLQSRTVSDHIIDRFHLQDAYKKRYRVDMVKFLAHHTSVVDDKKSGVITLTFTDTDPVRGREIAQAYIEELNALVNTTSTSSARREREFIENRLVTVKAQLHDAETALSNFSSVNTTLDIKAQTQTMVEAAAKLQAELIVAQSDLESLQQIYGNDNVRIRSTRARIESLQHELTKLSGSSAALPADMDGATRNADASDSTSLYPSLRQLPRLAVPYAALYRDVRIQETVFELLSQQYEAARIEEAKDTPVVSVFDPPLVAEKKSSPHRLIIILIATALAGIFCSVFLLLRDRWRNVGEADPRRRLAQRIVTNLRGMLPNIGPPGGFR